jgi:hypothetical protein
MYTASLPGGMELMLRKAALLTLIGGLCLTSLSAQSNDRLDELLAQAPARLDSAAYLVLSAAKIIPETATPAEAFDAALSAGLIPKTSKPEGTVSVQDLSYLLMKSLKLPGGLEWTFFPNPRAAYRELVYREEANGSAGPDRAVAGDEVVRTLTAVQSPRSEQ